jgi:hypothetical protein
VVLPILNFVDNVRVKRFGTYKELGKSEHFDI